MTPASNTGPLVALAKIDSLLLLKGLFGTVRVPPAVHRELLAGTGPAALRLDQAFAGFLQVAGLPTVPTIVDEATRGLGAGEAQAIALAFSEDTLLLIDDRAGRAAARRLGLAITGTVGVLLQAKQAGLIPQVLPLLDQMRQAGDYLSEALLDSAARLAGEQRG